MFLEAPGGRRKAEILLLQIGETPQNAQDFSRGLYALKNTIVVDLKLG
jgi:hypothetical protein